ncbi:hypothetical protein HHK36_022822 [Tetracentron sinense]|uniref:EID1-like F-box protein 3 n=1 Tax=Tetracentron sinense TaxID=13715 RepID=A0A834YQP3_TETSI|nr:hypothetical protein HHK36_022822 [Tetracentron sinense]
MNENQRSRHNTLSDDSNSGDSGILNERVLMLIFESINWDRHVLCSLASVCRKLRAIAKRLLWKELCVSRVPRMVSALLYGAPNGRVGGGWHAMAKLLFFCCGGDSSRHFRVNRASPGHFVKESRFSKTSGRSFLIKNCQQDLLYLSDPCEHPMGDNVDNLGVYRGVFQGFSKSMTRDCLIRRQAELEERVRCPFCGTRVWSMTRARLVPRSASRRVGSEDGRLEYFVCVNGHLHGTCWLAQLSSEEEDNDYNGEDGVRIASTDNGRLSSSESEEEVEDGASSLISMC